jgi:hypothetical protein
VLARVPFAVHAVTDAVVQQQGGWNARGGLALVALQAVRAGVLPHDRDGEGADAVLVEQRLQAGVLVHAAAQLSQGRRVPGLNDVFGPKGNALGDYLRAALLVPVSRSYRPGERSRTYRLSRAGFDAVEAMLGARGHASLWWH